ncbi:putative membrane protein [Burkholderia sp. Ch1-1]|uniref:Putative membrane protein n=1 Tax=Paraburkholderia dioscoreae TaxID=2604047 RepID=A0A5Q4ZGP3_9BURK|nr:MULTISPECIES: TPM domain-containing protein [Paraburkholderia]EIF30854.1 putative membrane protein [Burkholderia sp. Ch1-1]MDR8398486.1 TPM domain-containing protein [Paraburkholderia sp. USG1]VVD28904.1 putative membrane protein [Paraburkholderia dioscoreae]
MNLERIVRHLLLTRWHVNQAFPVPVLRAIDKAVRDSHAAHMGQIRFAVEGTLHIAALWEGISARERAIDVFSQLRVWDTEHNNGILIYLLLADHDVEIVADRGVHARVGPGEWEAICQRMEAEFKRGNYEAGVLSGVEQVTELLRKHFPAETGICEELPSKPAIL